jgi:hypothetical protein
MILGAGHDCPDLFRQFGESAEEAVVRVLEQYRRLNLREVQSPTMKATSSASEQNPKDPGWLDYKERLMAREFDLLVMEAELRDQKSKHKQEVSDLQIRMKSLQREVMQKDVKMGENAMKYDKKISSLSQEQQSAIKKLGQECVALNAEIGLLKVAKTELADSYAARLRQETDKLLAEQAAHNDQVYKLRRDTEEKFGRAQELHRKSQVNLRESLDKLHKQLDMERTKREACATELEATKSQMEEQTLHTKAQFEERERYYKEISYKVRIAFEKKLTKLQDQLRNQEDLVRQAQTTHEERFMEEKSRLEVELRHQKLMLTEIHQEEKYQLRAVIEDFKLASATREQFKGLTNADLTSRFSKLAQEIEDFARLDWDAVRGSQWWTQQLQQLNPRNTRKLKQKIVQNSLWISLDDCIFRSPFRLFAAEQEWKGLDKDWIEIYAFGECHCP